MSLGCVHFIDNFFSIILIFRVFCNFMYTNYRRLSVSDSDQVTFVTTFIITGSVRGHSIYIFTSEVYVKRVIVIMVEKELKYVTVTAWLVMCSNGCPVFKLYNQVVLCMWRHLHVEINFINSCAFIILWQAPYDE